MSIFTYFSSRLQPTGRYNAKPFIFNIWSIVEDLIIDKKPLAKRKFISCLKISFVDILYYGLIEK